MRKRVELLLRPITSRSTRSLVEEHRGDSRNTLVTSPSPVSIPLLDNANSSDAHSPIDQADDPDTGTAAMQLLDLSIKAMSSASAVGYAVSHTPSTPYQRR